MYPTRIRPGRALYSIAFKKLKKWLSLPLIFKKQINILLKNWSILTSGLIQKTLPDLAIHSLKLTKLRNKLMQANNEYGLNKNPNYINRNPLSKTTALKAV